MPQAARARVPRPAALPHPCRVVDGLHSRLDRTAQPGAREIAGAIAGVVLGLVTGVTRADALETSFGESMSADGRFVVFTSTATDLVPGQLDQNDSFDVFLRDRFARTTTLVSHAASAAGTAADGGLVGSVAGPISHDGRWVTFLSDATDLAPGQVDTNQTLDAFLYDRLGGAIALLSHASEGPAIAANGFTLTVAISADGNYVAFSSLARNLLAGLVDSNQRPGEPGSGGDVFLYHRPTGALALVSHRSGAANTTANGDSGASGISADGGIVVFTSNASNLVAGVADANGAADVFAYERSSGAVALVSRASATPLRAGNGSSVGGQVSGDGRWVAFQSTATDLVAKQVDTADSWDELLFDRVTGKTLLVSHRSGSPRRAVGAGPHAFSADGRYLAFASAAPNLVPRQRDANGLLDVFLFDRVAGTTSLITHEPGAAATASPGSTYVELDIDRSGRRVAILSPAGTLAPGQIDPRGFADAFLYDRVEDTVALVSHRRSAPTTTADRGTFSAHLSAGGSAVGFTSSAGDLTAAPGDPADSEDVFVYLPTTAAVEGISRPTGQPFAACTLLDTRIAGEPLRSNVRRLVSAAGRCGVPAKARAVAVEVTALQGTAPGNLRLAPGDGAEPSGGILRFGAGATRTGGFTVPLASSGAGTLAIVPLVQGGGTVHAVVVVTGWSD